MARLQVLALAATLLLAVGCAHAAGGRQLQDAAVSASPSGMMAGAPAPGPAMGKPMADIHFTLTAARAVLAADTLTLTGVAPVALYTTAAQGVGMTTVKDFANSTAHGAYVNSAGQWLADPAAVLVGMSNGAASKALVKLSNPKLSADNSTLTFQVAILDAASADAVPYEGGATARLIDDKQNGLATGLLTSAAGAPLTDAALFIDANSQTLGPDAQTKFLFWGPWWGGWGRRWGWGGGWRHGWGK